MWRAHHERIASQMLAKQSRRPLRLDIVTGIQASVAEAYGVPAADLKRPHGGKLISEAKRHAMHLARDAGFSTKQIGRLFGGIHHTTVIHYLSHEVKDPRQIRPTLAQRVLALESLVAQLSDELRRFTASTAPTSPVQPEPNTPVRSKPVESARVQSAEEPNRIQPARTARTQKRAG